MLASSMGQRDTFVGTYNYMSPERISGITYDYRSDIWSLGMVVLECAIGRFPYIQSEDQQSWPSFYELLEAIVESPHLLLHLISSLQSSVHLCHPGSITASKRIIGID